MAGFGDFYNKKSKKKSKEEMAKKAAQSSSSTSWTFKAPEIIKKKEKTW